tara:strand:- start:326 stop:706 length:381 start_codon:yes stop_codon:yes gene_type:complete
MPKTIPELTNAPAAIGPYSVATEANGFVFISGQIGIHPETGKIVEGGTAAETQQIMDNLTAILQELDLSFADVVKTTIFLVDMQDFVLVNDIYSGYFEGHNPARSTVQVAGLPNGVNIEIETLAAR